LNKRAVRRLAVAAAIKVVITNYPRAKRRMEAVNILKIPAPVPQNPFRALAYIERDDFMETPRQSISGSVRWDVRLKYAYIIKVRSGRKGLERQYY